MGRYSYPHVIDNGAGERLTFLRCVAGATGDRIEGENLVAPGAGPPMHVHWYQEEGFTILEGTIGYQRPGEAARTAGPGETVIFKAGDAHRFWNAGDTPLRCASYVEPADNAEFLLTEIFASASRRGSAIPDLFDLAFLMQRYRREFTTLAVPAIVQRVLFPLLVFIGTLSGKYAKYRDAPPPVRR